MSDRAHLERGNLGPVLFGVLAFLIVVALLAGLRAGIAFLSARACTVCTFDARVARRRLRNRVSSSLHDGGSYDWARIGLIEAFMTEDHNRLDRLLEASDAGDVIDEASYAEMRRGLLRHIALEEKVLLLDARARRDGVPLPLAAQLRREHGRIAHALVAPPSHVGCTRLRLLLAEHNPLEEGATGLYATCDRLAGREAGGVVARLRGYPEVPVAPYYAGPHLVRAVASSFRSGER